MKPRDWTWLACAVGIHQYGAPIVDTRARIYVRCMRCHRISSGVSTNGQRHDVFEPLAVRIKGR